MKNRFHQPHPGAREYVQVQDVANPTGGKAPAGTRWWLTPTEYARWDSGWKAVLVDVEEWEKKKTVTTETRAERRELSDSPVADEKLAERRQARRQLRDYDNTMLDLTDTEDK